MAGDGDPIDFTELAAALLQRAEVLVPQWLPGGKKSGKNWMCADFGGGPGRSLGVNMENGGWGEFSGEERGGDLISLYAAIHGLNNGQAARRLMAELGWTRAQPVQAPATRGQREPPPWDEGGPPLDVPPEMPPDEPGPPGDGPARGGRKKSLWKPVVPVPSNAPACDFWHWHYKAEDLVGTWAYEFEGQLYGHVARFRTSDGGKEVLPYTWCVDESDGRGTRRWHSKQWDEPRPLYVPATLLSGDPGNVPVVLVEGEKCARAGFELLPAEYDWVSWPGGGNAWPKAAWGWLMGRTVYLWPDADSKRAKLTPQEREAGVDPASKPLLPATKQPGLKTMIGIGSLLVAEFGCTVYLCRIPEPGAISDGWDVADAIEQGWTAENVREFIRGAAVFVPPDDAARARAAKVESTPSTAGAADDRAGMAWRGKLIPTEKGATKACRENVVLALDGLRLADGGWLQGIEACSGVIGYNEFTNDVMKLRPTPWGSPAGVWDEVDELLMGEYLVREHWLPSMPRGTLEEAVRMVAYRHRFHPVRQYLEGLKWDRQPRLATWLRRAVLEEDEWDDRSALQRYLARAGTWFLQGMVARVMEPGVKFDYMLILEGAQGLRKSTLLATLAGEFFADTGLVLGEKDSYQQLQGRWLYEFPELDAFSKADVTKIKAFIASVSDYFRASFDKRARDYPRQLVFGGSTNEDHYLTDPTGNRRFWPVRVTRPIDIEWVIENRDQLFAEAVERVRQGKRMYPTPDEERELFAPQQQARAVENAIETAISHYLNEKEEGLLLDKTTLVALLGKIGIGVEKLGPGRFHEKQAAAALRRLGWVEGRSSEPGRPRVYRRPDPTIADGRPGGSPGSTGATQAQTTEDLDGCPI